MGFYFVTKKVSANSSINGNSYQTSSEKNLVYLDVKTKKEKKVFSMDFLMIMLNGMLLDVVIKSNFTWNRFWKKGFR